MNTKTVTETLLERRSIRRYEREAISEQDMELIYDAIRNTPTSYNGQQYSVIDITDQPLKEKLYEIIGAKQIKICNHFLAFLADFHKISLLARMKGTFLVCGLAIGVPREMPDLKPKQPEGLTIFKNEYPDDSVLEPQLTAYDSEITLYNTTREGTKTTNDWGLHIISYYKEAMGYRILEALRRQGFDITR